jgi:prephenate dehydrogenase
MATMANVINIGILGMGRIGASFGMALKRYNGVKNAPQQFTVTAYDNNDKRLNMAKERGAFDHQSRNLYDAIRDKALIFIALPYSEVQLAYREIAGAASPGTVIMDASPLKSTSLAWADKALKSDSDVHLICVTPIFNPNYLFDGLDDTEHAAADLFDKGGMLLLPSAKCAPEAVELISDLCELIGAPPRYADPEEHDGWAAATEGLPALLGLATMYSLTRTQSWKDAQRQGNNSFGRLIHHLYDTHPDDLRDLLLNNRASMVRQLDNLSETLNSLRDILAQNDVASLEAALIETTDAAHLWVTNRKENRWDGDGKTSEGSTSGMIMTSLLGGFVMRRIRGDDEKK